MDKPSGSMPSPTSASSSSSSAWSPASSSGGKPANIRKRPLMGITKSTKSTSSKDKRLAANARERKRMHLLNEAYDKLRRRLQDAENKSKYDVLVQAKEYIQALAAICEKSDREKLNEDTMSKKIKPIEQFRSSNNHKATHINDTESLTQLSAVNMTIQRHSRPTTYTDHSIIIHGSTSDCTITPIHQCQIPASGLPLSPVSSCSGPYSPAEPQQNIRQPVIVGFQQDQQVSYMQQHKQLGLV